MNDEHKPILINTAELVSLFLMLAGIYYSWFAFTHLKVMDILFAIVGSFILINYFPAKFPLNCLDEKCRKGVVVLLVFGLIWTGHVFIDTCGTTSIGSLFERADYSEYYYVNMAPKGYNSENYSVVALIHASTRNYGKRRVYMIEKAIYPNYGNVTFYNSDNPDYALRVGEQIQVKDDKQKIWFIQLSTQKAAGF